MEKFLVSVILRWSTTLGHDFFKSPRYFGWTLRTLRALNPPKNAPISSDKQLSLHSHSKLPSHLIRMRLKLGCVRRSIPHLHIHHFSVFKLAQSQRSLTNIVPSPSCFCLAGKCIKQRCPLQCQLQSSLTHYLKNRQLQVNKRYL